jgi:hypothetical protein
MKLLYRIGADIILIAHFFLVLLAICGFLIPSLWYAYMAVLIATLVSDLVFGYCILSKWEFDLRKRINPKINYDFAWTTYYTYKLTNQRISNTFYKHAATTTLVLCIALNLYFKFWF